MTRRGMIGAAALVLPSIGAAPPRQSGMATRMLAAAGKPVAEREGERVVSGDAIVAATVNGRPLRLRIEPSLPGLVLVAPALAPGLGLRKPGFFGIGVGYRIGRQTTFGATQVVALGLAGETPGKRRIGWMSNPYVPAADGTIGPGGLSDATIRFALHPPRAGERTVTLPMHGGTGLFGGWFVLDAAASIAGKPSFIRFDPYHRASLVNAPLAVAIAGAHAGVMTPETGRQEIAFGIERPYRMLRLGRPLAIGGLSLERLGVRITDGDIAGRIAEEGAGADKADPDEVVVTAKGKPRPGILILGADALAACSDLVFDKRARVIRLTCGGG